MIRSGFMVLMQFLKVFNQIMYPLSIQKLLQLVEIRQKRDYVPFE